MGDSKLDLQIKEFLSETISPILHAHRGDVEFVRFEEGNLTVRFLGECAGCASASETLVDIIAGPLMAKFNMIKNVELTDSVSDETVDMVRRVLRGLPPVG